MLKRPKRNTHRNRCVFVLVKGEINETKGSCCCEYRIPHGREQAVNDLRMFFEFRLHSGGEYAIMKTLIEQEESRCVFILAEPTT